MNAVVFDTLILSRKLEAAGLPTSQAQGSAAALAETLGEQIVTRRDLVDLDARMDARFRALEASIDARFQRSDDRFTAFEASIDARFRHSETTNDARFRELDTTLRTEIRAAEQRQTIRLGTMLAASVVLVGALIRLL